MEIRPFDLFNKDWALLTAGPVGDHNSMTISWGELGTLWNKRVATVYVKPCRYTYSFMEKNDYFTISFFAEEYRNALSIMGSKSGRDVDKDQLSGLTPIDYDGVTIYREAKTTLICKKIYFNDLLLDNVPVEAVKLYYQKEAPHRIYIGEVIKIIDNKMI